MTDSSDLSSTEKLLDTIRGDVPPPLVTSPIPEISVHKPDPMRGSNIKTNIKHSLCTGVHIGNNALSLVLTGEQKQGAPKEVIKWEVVPFPDHMEFTNSRFPAFLRASLSSFLDGQKNIDIWASVSTGNLKLKNLIIPNIPDSKIANAALWGLKKEIEINPEAEIFDYEYIGETRINGIKKKNVVAFTGNKDNIRQIQAMFSSAGYSLTGITATPFAIQNYILTGQLQTGENPIVVVNIRRYRSEIFCMSENGILVARSIKTGSYSLAENYLESDESIPETAGKNADVPALLSGITQVNSPEFELMESSASRLIGKIQRTGEYCSNMYLSNEPISKYYLFGETDNCEAFNSFARGMMENRVRIFSPTEDDIISIGVKLPTTAEARNGIIPALGLALSHNDHTPNFLYTFAEKEIEKRTKKINKGVIAAGLVGLMLCGGVWFYFNGIEKNEIAKKKAVETELAGFSKSVNKDILNNRIGDAQKQIDMIRRYADDYISLAVINEICTLTPENISIISLDADFRNGQGEGEKIAPKKDDKRNGNRKFVKIQGIVSADFTFLESTLTGYVIKLSDSLLFGDINLENKKVEQSGDTSILKFTADMEIL